MSIALMNKDQQSPKGFCGMTINSECLSWLNRISESQDPRILPSLGRLEWGYIQMVLRDCEGNVSQSARRLGLHRRTLQRKLRKLPPYR
jgi:ActR/RegA family two-component response regulator